MEALGAAESREGANNSHRVLRALMRCQQDAKKGFFKNRNATVFSFRLKGFEDGWCGGKRGCWRMGCPAQPLGLAGWQEALGFPLHCFKAQDFPQKYSLPWWVKWERVIVGSVGSPVLLGS